MKKRQRKKFASMDASGVKEIASMQNRIDDLENALWRLAMMTEGKDDCRSLVKFTDVGSIVEVAMEKLYDFIKKHIEDAKDSQRDNA